LKKIIPTTRLKTGRRVKNLHALVLLYVGLMLAASLAASETDPDLLTPVERAWLAEHPWKSGFF